MQQVEVQQHELTAICKHWSRKGRCLFADACKYRHPPEAAATAATPSSAKSQRRNRRHLSNSSNTSTLFRCWLLEQFGHARLQSGSGILDVAGGHGELSFQLKALNRIECTVVDPRPLRLDRWFKRLSFGVYHRNAALADKYIHVSFDDELAAATAAAGASATTPIAHNSTIESTRKIVFDSARHAPQHIRTLFSIKLVQCLTSNNDKPASSSAAEESIATPQQTLEHEIDHARSLTWGNKGLTDYEQIQYEPISVQQTAIPNSADGHGILLTDATMVARVFQQCSLVIGLHCDQAAGWCVCCTAASLTCG
jgi:hypothetical protein